VKDLAVLVCAAMAVCACHRDGVAVVGAHASRPNGPASLYRTPPAATGSSLQADSHVRLVGHAEPGARVRLASPSGQAVFARSGSDGIWRIDVAAPTAPRLFGLAMVDGSRLVQSEGYLAVAPAGTAAQLRAGAGALVLGDRTVPPVIDAVDFDSKGGAVVSGRASPHAAVTVLVDGALRAQGVATAAGLFSLALDEPQSFADHRLEVVEAGRRASASVTLTPPARLSGVPYQSERTPSGWRIDWITPGGGLQTTLLISHEGAAA
jgi:hypothetical protein